MSESATVCEVREGDVIVDNTLLSDMGCSTRGAMRHVLGLTTADDDESKELKAGSALHEALAWWLSGKTPESALARFTETYAAWARDHVPPDDARAYKNLYRILAHWFEKHPLAEWQFRVDPSEVEVPLAHPLGTITGSTKPKIEPLEKGLLGPRVVMVALLDAIGKLRTGGKWSVDHKSTGWTGDRFKDKQEDSSQFSGQLWLSIQRGLKLAGVYINGIHVKEVPSSDYKCRNHPPMKYSECGMKHLDHMLFPVTRTAHEIDAWAKTARKLAQRYLNLRAKVKSVEDVRSLPMEGRFHGMCQYCPYRDWCRLGRPVGAVRTFKQQFWNPLEHAKGHVQALKDARNEAD